MNSGIHPEELFLTSISRYQWMDELNGSQNRDLFKHYVENGSEYLLMPIGIKDQTKPIEEKNLVIDFDYAIKLKRAIFKLGIDVKEDDMCKVVLSEAEVL